MEYSESQEAFEGGARRTMQGGRYDLIPPAVIHAMARRLKLGAAKYGDRNWELGGEAYRQATLSHLLAHIAAYMESGGRENTDAIACNAAFLCHFEEKIPLKPSVS